MVSTCQVPGAWSGGRTDSPVAFRTGGVVCFICRPMSSIYLPFSAAYAAITTSIGTPNSSGQRCAYRAPATNEVGHLAKTLGAFLFARSREGAKAHSEQAR